MKSNIIGWIERTLPLLLLELVIVSTNVIGASFLLFGDEEYFAWSYCFNGMYLPPIMNNKIAEICLLTYAPPVIIIVTYFIGLKIGKKIHPFNRWHHYIENAAAPGKKQAKAILMLVIVAIIAETIKILCVIDIQDILNWTSWKLFYATRFTLMGAMRFFDWVAIYTLVPLGIAGIILIEERVSKRDLAIILAYIFLNIIIFQKKPLICGIIIIFMAYVLRVLKRGLITNKKVIAFAAVMILVYISYVAGIYVNTLSNTYIPEEGGVSAVFPKSGVNDNIDDIFKTFKRKRVPMQTEGLPIWVVKMANYGLLNRTAYCGIIYPIIFPEVHDYYPFTIHSIMTAKDDNIVAGRYLMQNPATQVVCPSVFYVMMYAYGGIIWSMASAGIVGLALGLSWGLVKERAGDSLLGIYALCILLFSLNAGLGSIGDAVFSSYGIVYPVFLLSVYLGMVSIWNFAKECN